MITLKTPAEIKIMKEGGKISTKALRAVLACIKPGITTLELDKIAHETILASGAKPSFMTVDDYKYTTCININDGIVHGIPNDYEIQPGDIVSIDLGVLYQGLHTDISYTVEVETQKERIFLDVGKKALTAAIKQCVLGKHIGDVSQAIETIVEGAGYTVSEELVGHGVGHELHEDPYVAGYGRKGAGPLLKEGMTLAIEIIYQKGQPKLRIDKDKWTLRTADGSLSGLFEQSVAVTTTGPLILTAF